ncbi:MAG TPA: N-acetylmuramoyl-L-alanine amidase [Verrucomicrobiae bacterium]
MFKFAGIIFVASLLLAGCSTSPPQPPAQVEEAEPVSGTSQLNWNTSNAPEIYQPRVYQEPEAPAAHPNPKPQAVQQQPVPRVNAWVPLREWAAAHHIGSPHRLRDLSVAEYAVGSNRGEMVLEIGSIEATWNDVAINLGFAPQLIDGDIYLDELDLQKNLEPLLCDPPLAFTGNHVIVIDPGHGGSNTGTHSVLDGRNEKEFTLDLALRLKPLLETNGWTVYLIRNSDEYVANSNRVVFATAHHADLYISLHFNSGAPDTKQAGLETYCYTPTGMPSTVTRGYSDPWPEKLSSNDFDGQSLQLAVKLQGALIHDIGMKDRGVRHVRYIEVLRNQKCPAVLIENGYLSNPAEARLIESGDYRQKLAVAIAAALK